MSEIMAYALKCGAGWRVDCWGVVDRLKHPRTVRAGEDLVLHVGWSNLGVTPGYTRRTLAYRLTNEHATQIFHSDRDVRKWLPGSREVRETFRLPAALPAGPYAIEAAILDRPGEHPRTDPLPPLQVGIEGRRADGWYRLSQIDVR